MDRVSTASSYGSALLNIMNAQSRVDTAASQVSTGKQASDLKGYAPKADTITAAQTLSSRLQAYGDAGTALADKLAAQDQALSGVASAATGARQAVAEALATGDASALVTTLQSAFSQASSALNTQYDGQYLFSGGQTSTRPVQAATLGALASGGVAAAFKNGSTPTISRLDDHTTVSTGFTASDVGTPLFTALAAIQAYATGPGAPLTGTLTSAQSTFLSAQLSTLDAAYAGVNDQVAANGVTQSRVDDSNTSLKAQQTALKGVVGDLTDVDEAQAASDLTLSQVALQASAQVFASLKGASLLNVLSTTA